MKMNPTDVFFSMELELFHLKLSIKAAILDLIFNMQTSEILEEAYILPLMPAILIMDSLTLSAKINGKC